MPSLRFLFVRIFVLGATAYGGPAGTAQGKEYLQVALLAAFVCLLLALSYLADPKIAALTLSLAKIGAVAFGGMFTGILSPDPLS